ncbi:MAG: hypothetical protein GQ580_03420 [Candidatus Thorarchaeota archaeon]|nr:hypothetical protein [Candidatus Thorarchaeota archaeon]
MASFTANTMFIFSNIQQAINEGGSFDSDGHRSGNLDCGVNRVGSVQSILLLVIFLVGSLALLHEVKEEIVNSAFRIINRSIIAPWDLNTFLHLESNLHDPDQCYKFAEETVVSMGHGYSGKFDQAVLRFDGVPILEVVIERKFPVRNLPEIVRTEDMFQTELYVLALMESGVSCSSTRLAVIYCTQEDASNCVSLGKGVNCFGCRKGRVFQQKFNLEKVLKTLKKLDEIWCMERKPMPSPEVGKCRACPYGTNGVCNHSAA